MMILIIIIIIIMFSGCSNNGDKWVKHLSSGDCYECSCIGSTVRCSSSAVLCVTGCPGITAPVPGKCCPKCVPSECDNARVFQLGLGDPWLVNIIIAYFRIILF